MRLKLGQLIHRLEVFNYKIEDFLEKTEKTRTRSTQEWWQQFLNATIAIRRQALSLWKEGVGLPELDISLEAQQEIHRWLDESASKLETAKKQINVYFKEHDLPWRL